MLVELCSLEMVALRRIIGPEEPIFASRTAGVDREAEDERVGWRRQANVLSISLKVWIRKRRLHWCQSHAYHFGLTRTAVLLELQLIHHSRCCLHVARRWRDGLS